MGKDSPVPSPDTPLELDDVTHGLRARRPGNAGFDGPGSLLDVPQLHAAGAEGRP